MNDPTLKFTIYGRPQQRGSKVSIVRRDKVGKIIEKDGRPLTFTKDSNKKSDDWMAQVRSTAAEIMNGRTLLSGPIILQVHFFFLRLKSHFKKDQFGGDLKASAPLHHAKSPDLAKLLRSLEDGLTGVVWTDDKLVFKYHDCGREYTTGSERAEITIWEISVPEPPPKPEKKAKRDKTLASMPQSLLDLCDGKGVNLD